MKNAGPMLARLAAKLTKFVAEWAVDCRCQNDERNFIMVDHVGLLAKPQEGASNEMREVASFKRVGWTFKLDQRKSFQERHQGGDFPPAGFRQLPALAANQQDVHLQRHLADEYFAYNRKSIGQSVSEHSHKQRMPHRSRLAGLLAVTGTFGFLRVGHFNNPGRSLSTFNINSPNAVFAQANHDRVNRRASSL